MSNCIEIVYKYKVKLRPKEVDGYALRKLLQKAEMEVNRSNSVDDKIPWKLRTAWWFLSRNTIIKGNHGVEIVFGAGRSSHTWRDFKSTLELLKEFIRCPVLVNFGFKDEYDGFKAIFRETINLQTGIE